MKKITDAEINKHHFTFNEDGNGGEQLILSTTICDNGDDVDNIYFLQELTLESYGNSATFTLGNANLTPYNLRKLADELDREINKFKK